MDLTPEEKERLRICCLNFPFRIIYIARKPGEETIIDAVFTRHRPNRLTREGWEVGIVTAQK